ncbi:MAG: caspase family protein [Mesorhizobium sp.]
MRNIAGYFAVILTVLYSTSSLSQDRLAFLIGNDKYKNIIGLENAAADANTIGSITKKLGFKTIVANDLTQSELNHALSGFEKEVDVGDTVLFFYSGHGVEIDSRNYLLPVDVPAAEAEDADLIRRSSLPIDDLISSARNHGAKTVIAIIDACRDNPFAAASTRGASRLSGLARMETPDGVFILFSAGIRQRALDRLGPSDKDPNSVFTRVLRNYISQPGMDITDVAKHVRADVKSLAARINFKQSPAYFDQLDGTIILVPKGAKVTIETGGADSAADDKASSAAMETAYWNGVMLANDEASYRSYLDKVQDGSFDGLFADLARQRLEALAAVAKAPAKDTEHKQPAKDKAGAEQVAVLGGPKKIFTAGKNGTVFVKGSFTNQGNGEWLEENSENEGNPLAFQALDVSSERILLYDSDRDIYLELNLKSKHTRWKRGDVKNWNSLYKITKVVK